MRILAPLLAGMVALSVSVAPAEQIVIQNGLATVPAEQTVIQDGDNTTEQQASNRRSARKFVSVIRKLLRPTPIPIEQVPWTVVCGNYTGTIIRTNWVLSLYWQSSWGYVKPYFIKTKGSTLNFGDGEIFWIDSSFPRGSGKDIILFRLKKHIKFDKFAQALTIPDPSMVKAGTKVTVAGWGALSVNFTHPHYLKQDVFLMSVSASIKDCNYQHNSIYHSCLDWVVTSAHRDFGDPVSHDGSLFGIIAGWWNGLDDVKREVGIRNISTYKEWISSTMDKASDQRKEEQVAILGPNRRNKCRC